MKAEEIDSFPAGTNVFIDDIENMGTLIGIRGERDKAGQRVIIMHRGSDARFPLRFLIVADELTGERIKITF